MTEALTENTRISVVVASRGRPECLRALLRRLSAQTLLPQRVVFAITTIEDAPARSDSANDCGEIEPEIVISPKGLCHQRNRGLERVIGNTDVVAFFDDDYVPSRDAVRGIARAFATYPAVSGVTGVLLADGINGPGISLGEAARMVDDRDTREPERRGVSTPKIVERLEGLYGCNMAFRTTAIGAIRFDEHLPLYAWQEDIDFSAQVHGEMVRTDAFFGVHCGVKSGREIGKRLGYSQIANPLWGTSKNCPDPGATVCSP